MQLQHKNGSDFHLTYCSNIHAGESLRAVLDNIKQHIPLVRQALNSDHKFGDDKFGLGLRLSAQAAKDLANTEAQQELQQILDEQRCYIFTINGFPYGPFHGTRVKEEVYLPDWKDEERLRYTNQLADLFAIFLDSKQIGSISTVPGAFKENVKTEQDRLTMTRLFVCHCAHLARLEELTGKSINLALEPEPCCFLETVEESVDFFSNYLYSEFAIQQLQQDLNVDEDKAAQLLRKHLTLCLDLCHAAVEFEHASQCISALRKADITIGKLQISAGLRLQDVNTKRAESLKPFIDEVYLHQVVENHDGTINRYSDLPLAFEKLVDDGLPREWRVHFHVPIFLDNLGEFSSTRFFISEALKLHTQDPLSSHLEVETYTWDVLPEAYKKQSLNDAIARELDWVRGEL